MTSAPVFRRFAFAYGTAFALRIVALMFSTIVLAALAIDALFSSAGLIPTGPRPSRAQIFGSVSVDYKLILNILGVVIFAGLFWLTRRRGATDPVCGMKVDRAKAIRRDVGGRTLHFCSDRCASAFEARPQT